MNESSATSTEVQPTPAEQAVAAEIERDQHLTPSDDAPRSTASAAGISPDTVASDVTGAGAGAATGTPTEPLVATVTAGGEVELECPGCGLILVGESPRPTAAWFCPRCDFPAFWAAPPSPEAPPQRRARRRLPGTSGTQTVGSTACWNCGEHNEPDVSTCVRCAATVPKPLAPVVERIVEVATTVPVPHVVRTVAWPYVVAGCLGGAAVAIAGTIAILRLAGALVTGGG